jgi:hypothetical protein
MMAVNPAVEATPIRCAVPPLRFSVSMKSRIASFSKKSAILDGKVDLAKVHRDDAAGADIGVPDLGIAHLRVVGLGRADAPSVENAKHDRFGRG